MSGRRARALREVLPLHPQQSTLPLPEPPESPFVRLAWKSRIGRGPSAKSIYIKVASLCPVKTSDWTQKGSATKATILNDCEIKKMDTVSGHLAGLREDGWLDWKLRKIKYGWALDFVVHLSPLHVLAGRRSEDSATPFEGYPEDSATPFEGCPENSATPFEGNQQPRLRGVPVRTLGLDIDDQVNVQDQVSTPAPPDAGSRPPDGDRPASASPALVGGAEKAGGVTSEAQVRYLVWLAGQYSAMSERAEYAAMPKDGEDGSTRWIERLKVRLKALPEDHLHAPAARGEQFERCECGVVRTSGDDWTLLHPGTLPATWEPMPNSPRTLDRGEAGEHRRAAHPGGSPGRQPAGEMRGLLARHLLGGLHSLRCLPCRHHGRAAERGLRQGAGRCP